MPSREVAPRPQNGAYVVVLLLISVLWSNSRMPDDLAGYDLFHLALIPRNFRFVEVFFISVTFVVAFVGSSFKKSADVRSLSILAIALFFGFASGVFNRVHFLDLLQGLFIYLSPLLVFYTARWNGFGLRELKTLKSVVSVIIAISIPIWTYQVAVYLLPRGAGDDVNGLFSDAHTFSMFLYCASLYVLGTALTTRKVSKIILFLVLLSVGFASFNEKATLLMIPVSLVGPLVVKAISSQRILGLIGVYALIFSLAIIGLGSFLDTAKMKLRIDAVINTPVEELGTTIAYTQLPQLYSNEPEAIIFGLGSGNYGSPIAIRKYVEGRSSDMSDRFVGDIMESGRRGALTWRVNYFVGMMVEQGGPFALAIIVFYLGQMRSLFRMARAKCGGLIAPYVLYVVGSVLLLLMVGAISTISNLDMGILTYPVMIAMGSTKNVLLDMKTGDQMT